MKHFFALLFFSVLTVCSLTAGEVKYVFLLIGDGFGPVQRAMTEAANGKPLVMNTLPLTFRNGTNNIKGTTTDSAASGTAIACGMKTYNSAIGVDNDGKPVESLASVLKRTRDFRVGIISSCAITDATPSAHYAHQLKRSAKDGIITDMTKCGFDFFGGTDLYSCNIGDNRDPEKVGHTEKKYRQQLKDAGFQIIDGENTLALLKEQNQMLGENPSIPMDQVYAACTPFTAWNKGDQAPYPALADYLTIAAERFAPNPFFIMLECGRIDHAGHNNDAAWTIREVNAFDAAVAAALDFQKKYPEETLIIVTADHETGGLLLTDEKKLKKNAKILWKQANRLGNIPPSILKKIKDREDADDVLDEVEDFLGFDDFTDEEEDLLEGMIETNYADPKTKIRRIGALEIVKKAAAMRDSRLGVKYTSGGHTSEKVVTNVSAPETKGKVPEVKENSDIRALIEFYLSGK